MTNENYKSFINEIKTGEDNNLSLLPSLKENDLLSIPSIKNIDFHMEEDEIGDDKNEFYTYYKNQIIKSDYSIKDKKEDNFFNKEIILNESYSDAINKKVDNNSDNSNHNINNSNDNDENNKNSKHTVKKEISNKKIKIFKINKIRRLGRLKKKSTRIGKHNKFSRDNVIRRFKALFINNIYKYVNSLFNINNYGKAKKNINLIKKIEPRFVKTISKEDNVKWLNSKLKEFFSQNISKKLLNFDNNYNMNLIKRIYEKKQEKKVIEVLEKTIKEMLYIYQNDDDQKICPGFKTIKDDIKYLKEKGENSSYIEMYSLVVENYEKLYDKIKSRKKREIIK